jgi:hypothetical protein
VPTVRPPTKRASKAFLSDMLQHGRVPATTLEAARDAKAGWLQSQNAEGHKETTEAGDGQAARTPSEPQPEDRPMSHADKLLSPARESRDHAEKILARDLAGYACQAQDARNR